MPDDAWSRALTTLREVHARSPGVLPSIERLIDLLRASDEFGTPRVSVGWLSFPLGRGAYLFVAFPDEERYEVGFHERDLEGSSRSASLQTVLEVMRAALAEARRDLCRAEPRPRSKEEPC